MTLPDLITDRANAVFWRIAFIKVRDGRHGQYRLNFMKERDSRHG